MLFYPLLTSLFYSGQTIWWNLPHSLPFDITNFRCFQFALFTISLLFRTLRYCAVSLPFGLLAISAKAIARLPTSATKYYYYCITVYTVTIEEEMPKNANFNKLDVTVLISYCSFMKLKGPKFPYFLLYEHLSIASKNETGIYLKTLYCSMGSGHCGQSSPPPYPGGGGE